jgi:NDP-sugar pyrophosphorylase family protein
MLTPLKSGALGAEVGAVIMAGGKGSRFGEFGRKLPKCLFPLPGEHTLLTRLMRQLHCSGIHRVTVCCSPENHAVVAAFLEAYRAKNECPGAQIKAVACASTRLGPLPALAETLSTVSAGWYLVCLGDIFFAEAAFDSFCGALAQDSSADGFLLTGTEETSRAGSGTGAVACKGTVVRAISYRPFPPEQVVSAQVRYWTGAVFFHAKLVDDLRSHLGEYREQPLETWLQGLLTRGSRFALIEAGPFVNVNSMREYQYFLTRNWGAG